MVILQKILYLCMTANLLNTHFLQVNILLILSNTIWSKETYEWAFRGSGFRNIKWVSPSISQKGIAKYGVLFWKYFLKKSSFVCIECN